MKKNLTTTREVRQAAYQAWQGENERIRSVQAAYGTAGIAARNIAQMQQKVHDEIVAKKKANIAAGLPERHDLPKYNEWLKQQDPLGGEAQITIREQGIEEAKEDQAKGVFRPLADKEGQKRRLEEISKPVDDMKAALETQSGEISRMAKEFGEQLKAAVPIKEMAEELNRVIKEMKADWLEFKLKNKTWWSGWTR